MSVWRRMLKAVHPEGIPWPGSVAYGALSGTGIFRRHYALVADDVLRGGEWHSLLDVGTGPARLLLELHRRCPDARLVGVDVSAAMVALAQANVRKAGCAEAIAIVEGSADSLPFPDGSFDVVVSTGSIHHWKAPVRGLGEVRRVLRPGGRALIYDLVTELPREVRRDGERRFGRFRMTLLALHSFEEPFRTVGEMEALARESAFGGCRTRFVGVLCCMEMQQVRRAGCTPA